MQIRQRITPLQSYVDRAEEAAAFYVSVLPDPQAIQRMFGSLWQMAKLDIATLQKAFDGQS